MPIVKVDSHSSTLLRPLDRASLWDRAYEALREELLAGRLQPGQRLPLRDIAAHLGISMTPVRDAINRLVAERVLERGSSGQGGGATVPMMRASDFDELTQVRTDLEGRATRKAAELATIKDIDRLERKLSAMRRLIAKGRLEEYLPLHRQFHFDLYATARMPLIYGMIENLWLRCGPVLTYVIPVYVLKMKGTDLHQATLDALSRRNGDDASAAIRADILQAAEYLLALASDDGVIQRPDPEASHASLGLQPQVSHTSQRGWP